MTSASFEIRSLSGSYQVEIALGAFDRFVSEHRDSIVVLCDEMFEGRLATSGVKVLPIPALESAKSLDAIPDVIIGMRRLGVTRGTHLVAVGGGIVQDVAAFCATVYMRGLEWSYVPTTLLGMADSCIGGKSSINVGEYKNIVGAFYPPKTISIDPQLTSTLSVEQMVAGLCEAAKICFCRAPDVLADYLAIDPAPGMSIEAVRDVVALSLASKKWFIEIDEFDQAERLLLNFGHTFGHAIEGASHFEVSHGVAVGVGMLCAIELGGRLGRDYGEAPHLGHFEAHIRSLLRHHTALRGLLADMSIAELIDRFAADKKHGPNNFAVVVVDAAGRAETLKLPKDSDSRELITQSFVAALRSV